MQKSFTGNYLKIYFWQGIAIILNLLSLFIVIPHISIYTDIYGIYSICLSVAIFLSYADLGFMGAGYKYASESYAKNDRNGEIRLIGFVTFILLIFICFYIVVILFLSFHPQLLIKNLSAGRDTSIASRLLFIQAFSSLIIILQRCLQIIFGIRLEDFIYQRIQILGSFFKILGIFYFFHATKYDIVGYYFYIQVISILCLIWGLKIAKSRYHYDLRLLLRSIRFTKGVYNRTKRLALGSFLLTIAWILYYELDTFFIARLSGSSAVAYYAIGLTILSFFRSIFGTLFGPFNARFNHFVGIGDNVGLRNFYRNVICITLPLVVFPIISLYILMKPFVIAWVGTTYLSSIPLARWLILSNILGFIAYPAGILVIAQHRVKLLNIVSFIFPIVFWGGILLTYKELGVTSFAIFKFLAFMLGGLVYIYITLQFLGMSFFAFLNKYIKPGIIPVIFVILGLKAVEGILPVEKGKLNMLFTVMTGGLASLGGLVLYSWISEGFRNYVVTLYARIKGGRIQQ